MQRHLLSTYSRGSIYSIYSRSSMHSRRSMHRHTGSNPKHRVRLIGQLLSNSGRCKIGQGSCRQTSGQVQTC